MQVIEILLIAISVLAVFLLLLGLIFHQRKKKKIVIGVMPAAWHALLEKDVLFYQGLSPEKRNEFESRMMRFLTTTKITGIKTEVEDADKVYIAASAIIPIFGFANWEYINLREVLLYPDSFSEAFDQEGHDRHTLGMVGDGPYNNIMILSRHDLRQAFINKTGKTNTAIHEFVHLVDKTDGSVDGVPEILTDKHYVLPWLNLMRQEIGKIIADRSDINPYGATSEAEFFAVVSEYFFERPGLLQEKHPELYKLLAQIFQQQPAENMPN